MKHLIGIGELNWPKGERVTDRYGCVSLNKGGGQDSEEEITDIKMDVGKFIGKKGTLTAKVISTRDSYHIGDLFRGLVPSKPEVDDGLTLGIGVLFIGEYNSVGLEPEDGRESDWLDPEVLYQLHCQTVELYFEEE